MSTVGATKSLSIDFDSVLADTMIAWTREYNKLKHTKESIRMFTCGCFLEPPQ
jgi:5'(3')-deoxyribonucleotidase